ncbi:MAG: flagellar motor switch protein FliN [Planctomycetaceae bacterium]|jgi:flagellar motor switch protein FliN|nr:flagellar motor switch protein FliN [Planctomycetaceae bacterium]MBT6157392.1 flagellar motor switch protein FliN [Planctomycetaceae bacterium]MBT6483444.1 flagellar motor switch protein FliN [Planctomycetaceae bacterium]MBT6493894.1 flagellar motor switch protein FliN [Planctomycetaceae bacterium]
MADEQDDDLLDPSDIEALLGAAGGGQSSPADAGDDQSAAGADDASDLLSSGDIEALLNQPSSASAAPPSAPDELLEQAESNLAAAVAPDLDSAPASSPGLGQPTPFGFSSFDNSDNAVATAANDLDALKDVELDLRIELGRTELLIEEVLRLKQGAVVPLDKLAGDPVDILVNGRIVARGEVLVLNDNFCVRVAEILSPDI